MNKDMNYFLEPYSSMLDMGTLMAIMAETISSLDYDQVQVGMTPKTRVFGTDKVSLYHYHPLAGEAPRTAPVLICYGLIGRYTMIDLQEDRSLVRNLLTRGVDLYVIDWGNPSRADQFLGFEDYICHYLDACVDFICDAHKLNSLSLFGICEGGVFTSMYAALYPEKIKNLILSITPIDFEADLKDEDPSHGFLNLWIRNLNVEDIDRLIAAYGNLSGEMMGGIFQAMTPIKTMTKYNLGFLEVANDDEKLLNFLRMEKWLADRPNHPGVAARQWLVELYKENRLVKGSFELAGQPVDLGKINMPILNIYAQRDHIIPPPCSTALGEHAGSTDYAELALPGGHVGIYVSSKLQGMVGDGISQWLLQRQ